MNTEVGKKERRSVDFVLEQLGEIGAVDLVEKVSDLLSLLHLDGHRRQHRPHEQQTGEPLGRLGRPFFLHHIRIERVYETVTSLGDCRLRCRFNVVRVYKNGRR